MTLSRSALAAKRGDEQEALVSGGSPKEVGSFLGDFLFNRYMGSAIAISLIAGAVIFARCT